MFGLRGRIVTTLTANPAAGANFSQAVPAGKRWGVIGIRFRVVTAVAVANRFVRLVIDDGANIYAHCAAPGFQTASQTTDFTLSPANYDTGVLAGAGNIERSLIGDWLGVEIPPLGRIRSLIDNIQAADQVSAIVLVVEEWDA